MAKFELSDSQCNRIPNSSNFN